MVLWTALGLSSVLATVIGVRRHRPRQRAAWLLLAAAEFTFTVGDTWVNVLADVVHQVDPFPSIADVFYLLTYLVLAAGILLFIRSRSPTRDRASLIDAMIITTGLGLLLWVYLVVPDFRAAGLSGLQRIISVAYPLGDILILALLARMVGAGGLRRRSTQLLLLGGAALITADVLHGVTQLNGNWTVGGPVDAGWAVFYVAWGGAALHPSMVEVGKALPQHTIGLGRGRVALLAAVSLIAPLVLLLQSETGSAVSATTVAWFSAALFLLVIARLWGILDGHQQSVHRERILRSTGQALVAAPGRPDIHRVALAAVRSLVGAKGVVRVAIYDVDADRIRCQAGSADRPDRLIERWGPALAGGGLTAGGKLSVTALGQDPDDRAMLVVETEVPLSPDEHGALSTLAAQVALAVESANLAETLRERHSEERFRGILQNTSDIIVIVNARGEITYGTPSLGRNLGWSSPDLLGRNLAEFLSDGDAAQAIALFADPATRSTHSQAIADWQLRHRDGSLTAFEVLSNNLLDDDRVRGVVLTMRDVSERRALEVQLKHQAFHDALTGLSNRALFQDRAEHALARTARVGTIVAMVMLDLDDFKTVNDTLGHAAGDELLVQVATRLQATLRRDATVSRFGGDEFAVLIEDLADAAQGRGLAERALQPFDTPFFVQGAELSVRASVGLVFAGGSHDSLSMTELMRCADLALYAAKERGKGQIVLYHRDLHTRMLERLTHRSELERAVEAEEFVLQFQPVVDMATGLILGCEALVRWLHPTRGMIPPSDFIELAEETGLIVELGRWVLDRACAQMSAWIVAGHGGINVSVNVSARQLREPAFVDEVRDALSRHELPPTQLIVELTESIFAIDASSIAEKLQSLRAMGVKIAMDDFGTGYSSLSYLQKFQLDILKIDKAFVDGLGAGDEDKRALVTAIISLAASLHLDVVAEGIENEAQRDELRSVGCRFGQGYLYSRPVAADDLPPLFGISLPVCPPGSVETTMPELEYVRV